MHGIAFLHHNKTIHKDIKSDNILYNYKGEIKLSDFGTSCILTKQKQDDDSIAGTVLFMAPEMCKNKAYGLPVDIWSFGVFCVELANLVRPNSDVDPFPTTPVEILKLIEKKGPPKLLGKWSKEFQTFVGRCLKVDPAERATANQLIFDEFIKGGQTKQAYFKQEMKIIKKEIDEKPAEKAVKTYQKLLLKKQKLEEEALLKAQSEQKEEKREKELELLRAKHEAERIAIEERE